MQFKDLVAKLDELIGTTPTGRPTAQQAIQASKATQAAQDPQASQTTQAAPNPPGEKPIPGQQPNLGPKTVVPQAAPQQVIGAQPAPAQQQQQANGGMAAAILQAVNQMKTQQPHLAPTSSQSIAQQQQQAAAQAKTLQTTAKPGEPLEEENKAPGLSDKEVKDWVYSLNKDPSYITHPEWKHIDNDSKVKILKTIKTEHPTVSSYIDVQRKIAKEKKSDAPDNDYIAQLEKEKSGAWDAHFAAKKQAPNKAEPVKADPAKKDAENKDKPEVVKKPEPVKPAPTGDGQTFSQAFSAARKEAKGPGGKFTWTDPKTGKTGTYTTAYKDEVKKDAVPVVNKDAEETPKVDDATKNWRRDDLERIMRSAGSDEPTIKSVLDKENPAKAATEYPPDDVINNMVAQKQKELAPKPVAAVPEPSPAPVEKKSGYSLFKKDAQGKSYLDPFNIGPSSTELAKQQPGDGPVIRDTSVKEMSLQSVVDELLNEDAPTKEDATSTASKWATKSAKLAPWVGNVAKGANIALSASDIADYTKKGDKVGAGIASAALAADAAGTVFPPASWASFALDAANAGRDVYLKQTGKEFKDPDQQSIPTKEELSNIVHLAKYKVDKK